MSSFMVDMFDCCAVADEFSVFPPVFLVRFFFVSFNSLGGIYRNINPLKRQQFDSNWSRRPAQIAF